jgi:endonuclease/exonuclease/phosphatase family metal-dependent hydrolase
MAGDFNLTVWCETYLHLNDGLSEAFIGAPSTFPAMSADIRRQSPFNRTQIKIDHGFVGPEAEFEAAEVLYLRGSDHYPVYYVVRPNP